MASVNHLPLAGAHFLFGLNLDLDRYQGDEFEIKVQRF